MINAKMFNVLKDSNVSLEYAKHKFNSALLKIMGLKFSIVLLLDQIIEHAQMLYI